MSINTIELNRAQLAGLYGRSLVVADPPRVSPEKPATMPPDAPTPPPASKMAADTPLSFLGKLEKRVVILVNYSNYAHLPDEQLNFLSAILNACKLTLEDVGILNISRNPGVTYELLEKLAPVHLILFGVSTAAIQAPVRIPDFQVQPLGQSTLLTSPPLDEMNVPGDAGKQLKGKLWLSLKKMFNI